MFKCIFQTVEDTLLEEFNFITMKFLSLIPYNSSIVHEPDCHFKFLETVYESDVSKVLYADI